MKTTQSYAPWEPIDDPRQAKAKRLADLDAQIDFFDSEPLRSHYTTLIAQLHSDRERVAATP